MLRLWPVWVRIKQRFEPVKPIPGAPHAIFLVRFRRWHRRAVTLPDGTTIGRGDRICELHIDGRELLALKDSWRMLRAMAVELRALAAWTERPDFPADVRALFGYTLLSRGAPRAGFTVRDRPIGLMIRLDRIFMLGLIALYSPRGVERLREGSTLAHYPQEVWMSRAELRRRYGGMAADGRPASIL